MRANARGTMPTLNSRSLGLSQAFVCISSQSCQIGASKRPLLLALAFDKPSEASADVANWPRRKKRYASTVYEVAKEEREAGKTEKARDGYYVIQKIWPGGGGVTCIALHVILPSAFSSGAIRKV